jgi:hypothetical protein
LVIGKCRIAVNSGYRLMARSLPDLFHECDGDDFFVVQEAVKRRLAGPNKQAATPRKKSPHPCGLSAKTASAALQIQWNNHCLQFAPCSHLFLLTTHRNKSGRLLASNDGHLEGVYDE